MKNIHRLRISWLLSLFMAVMSFVAPQAAVADSSSEMSSEADIKSAIVKIYTVSSTPDYFNPWRMSAPQNTGGSGCIIAGKNILTNAHVVADHTFIQVRRYGEARRYKARVLTISHDADLALLTVDDEAFFTDVPPLEFGEFAEPQQEVLVYGFPFGGDSLSITKGVLSRVEHHYYTHSSQFFLAGQIDAAINPGNSGGPVLVDGKIVGVVMQMYNPDYSENIGYMVPIPVINHFFEDIEDAQYDGFPDLGIMAQDMENPDIKRKYGMTEDQTGILVIVISPNSPAYGKIQQDDVLLTIDGHPIADDGTVEFRSQERTRYSYYVDQRQIGEEITAQVLRQGEIQQVSFPLNQTRDAYLLVPLEKYDQQPRYFVYGGIVFTPLTKNLLKQWGPNWPSAAPFELVAELYNQPTEDRKEVVVALQVLGADVNLGYHDVSSWVISEVNGQTIKDFSEFFHLVTRATEPYIVLKDDDGFQIVLDRQKAEDTHEEILQTYHIEHGRSPDLREDSR